MVCLLLVTAFADLHARGYLRSRAILTCLVGSLVLPSIVRCWFVEWNTELYAASCHGLAVIGKQDDVRGVVLIDLPRYLAGNYFYLRHPAPIRYLSSAAADGLALERDWQEGRLNYLVAPQGRLSATLRDRLEPIGSWRHWEYYRLRGSKLSLTGETALISRDSTVAPAGPFSETSTRPPHNR